MMTTSAEFTTKATATSTRITNCVVAIPEFVMETAFASRTVESAAVFFNPLSRTGNQSNHTSRRSPAKPGEVRPGFGEVELKKKNRPCAWLNRLSFGSIL